MKYYKDLDGKSYLFASDGSQDEFIANNMVSIEAPPTPSSVWESGAWVEPSISHQTASKLAILDYFDNTGLISEFLTILRNDELRYERWLAAQNISINDPMVDVVRLAMGWTNKQVQDLFNSLNQ